MIKSTWTRRLAFVGSVFALFFAGLVLTACSGEKSTEKEAATVEPAKTATSPASTPTPERQWSFRGQRGITAAFVPTDLALYRSLLPAAFDMPESPLIAVAVVNYYDVTLPLTPYGEGYVVMQCRYQGRTGWYVFTMPVDDETANMGGRSLGFPKYIADEIDLAETDDTWSGRVVYQGRDVMKVTFKSQAGSQPVERSSADAGLPIFLLLPPAQGPQVNEVKIQLFGERKTVTTAGSATIEADPGEAWAGLLPAGGVAASATFDTMTGEWVLTANQP